MSVALKPEQQQFIQKQIALGRFASEEEVLDKALQLLSSQYLEYDTWVEETRVKIDEAQAQIDRGEGIPLDKAIQSAKADFATLAATSVAGTL
jgi:antitoxin ParD1/3/4